MIPKDVERLYIASQAEGILQSRNETRIIFEEMGLEVLDGLRSVYGNPNETKRPPGRKFVDDIVEDQNVFAAVIKGPPGVGKSMILGQLRTAVEAHGIRTLTLFRDEVISSKENSYMIGEDSSDPRTDSQNWDEATRKSANNLFTLRVNGLIEQAKILSRTGQRTIVLVEAVGLGRGKTDRERGSLEDLYLENPGRIKTLSVIAHPKIIERNIQIRNEILGADGETPPSDDDILEILTKYSVLPTYRSNEDKKKTGQRIKSLVGKMAPGYVIKAILRELSDEAIEEIDKADQDNQLNAGTSLEENERSRTSIISGLSVLSPSHLKSFLHGSQIDAFMQEITGKDESDYVRNIAFLFWLRSRGIEDQEFIVYNDFLQSNLNWYIDKPLPKELGPDSDSAFFELLFIRHAEPKIYGEKDSSLTDRGILETQALARSIGSEIQTTGVPTRIWVFYGDRLRHQETARVFRNELVENLQANNAVDIEVSDPEFMKFLSRAEPLSQLSTYIDNIRRVYPEWIDGDQEELKARGIETPEEMRRQLETFAKNIQSKSLPTAINSGQRYVVIGFTSETLPASVLKNIIKTKKTPRISPLSGVRIKIRPDKIEYEVGGKKVTEVTNL